jgi:hypothetical protein
MFNVNEIGSVIKSQAANKIKLKLITDNYYNYNYCDDDNNDGNKHLICYT